jgi:hypothetical protein
MSYVRVGLRVRVPVQCEAANGQQLIAFASATLYLEAFLGQLGKEISAFASNCVILPL